MKVYHEELSDASRYIGKCKHVRLEDKEPQFKSILKCIRKVKVTSQDTRILEIGTGTGWFPILCKKNGIFCEGLEISPQLMEYAQRFGRRYGIEPDIKLGNIEEADIGISKYDIIIANFTFEHVEYWQKGIEKVFNALKPGGLLYFASTSKFSLWSGEYRFPFYGWLPNSWRYRLRISRQGEDIMKLGIDFNQFTYFQLRRFFKDIGFSKVLDPVEFIDPDDLELWKKIVLKMLKGFKPLKHLALFFSLKTFFICIK